MNEISCSSSCTVTLVITSEPFTAERAQADGVVFGAIVAFLCVLWGAKKLLSIFTTGRYE
jgi:hypothetical protein